MRKSLKLSPEAEPMMMLGGSPMSVATPPMLENSASESRNGAGLTSNISQRTMVTGAITTTVVTLSRNAETTAVTAPRNSSRRNELPRERRPA